MYQANIIIPIIGNKTKGLQGITATYLSIRYCNLHCTTDLPKGGGGDYDRFGKDWVTVLTFEKKIYSMHNAQVMMMC